MYSPIKGIQVESVGFWCSPRDCDPAESEESSEEERRIEAGQIDNDAACNRGKERACQPNTRLERNRCRGDSRINHLADVRKGQAERQLDRKSSEE